MKTRLLTFALVLTCVIKTLGQEDFRTIINSPVVKNKIKFNVLNDQLEFSLDDDTYKPLPKSLKLQGKSNSIILNSTFINPLKYKISLEYKQINDELEVAATEYLSQISTTLLSIGTTSSGSIMSGGRTSGATIKPVNVTLKNKHMIELFSFLYSFNNDFFIDEPVHDKLLNAMKRINNTGEKTAIDYYNMMFVNLWKMKSYESMDNTFETNKNLKSKIDSILKSKKDSIANLKSEFEAFKFNNFIADEVQKSNVYGIIGTKIKNVEDDFTSFEKTIGELKVKYEKMSSKFEEIIKNTYKEKEKETRIGNIAFEKGKVNETTVYITYYDFDTKTKSLKEKEKKQYVIQLRKYKKFIPVVSSGILYTDVSFKTFGTATNAMGETIIEEGNSVENEIAIGAYLNFYLNNGWNTPLFFQLGIGPSKERPLLFGGIGVNLASKLSFSTGLIYTWQPNLTELKVGDVVTGTTAIDNDIQYRFANKPNFYIGLTYNLTK
ncbi:hypothetical protein [Polaribacter aquimarinus]|uniref:Uncharacterized protein n=1 Tax=Polaribacter aquimarinus TaxID=2100726 RepID=A0A2U2J7U8_9FLAO|nr:hypothetical protein [Polaribacter aquimarinus]PWG04394.1 hypothetical protein DIS07_13395 [Polaribacter aquimarinus]